MYSTQSNDNPPHRYTHSLTGIPPKALASQYFITNKSSWGLIEQFYLEPLRAMTGHNAFICLTACFPLYEKYLRKSLPLGEEGHFSKGQPVFKSMGKHWGISADQAFEFWQHWRNGLQHRAMPNSGDNYRTCLKRDKHRALTVDKDGHLTLDPWLFRDKIITLLEESKKIWKDSDFPLLEERVLK